MKMLFYSQIVAEDKIKRAIKEGQFENLEGAGKPLPKDEAELLPPEMRMAYRILKNAGYTSPITQDNKEIAKIADMLDETEDEQERYRQMQKLNVLSERMNMRLNRPVNLEVEEYFERVVRKVDINND